MQSETPIRVTEAVENIEQGEYLLPSIQRELVWDTDRIVRLFDSLMRGFPIGSFLFWRVPQTKIADLQFYEFIREYHEKDKRHNPKADTRGKHTLTGVLDGQQRLTALWIGLKGSYAEKLPRKRWDNDAAFPKKYLYLNLLQPADDADMKYDFRFLTTSEAQRSISNGYWFRVGDILNLQQESRVSQYLATPRLREDEKVYLYASEVLFRLHRIVHIEPSINYYLEKSDNLDQVLNIFVRVNQSGKPLSYSDMLLSLASASWQQRDAREEMTQLVDELNRIRNGFNFDNDYVLKSCLVLSDSGNIAFKVDNFGKKRMQEIEGDWDRFSQALRLAVHTIASLGYDRTTLAANYVTIPIAYYLLKRDLPQGFPESSKYVDDRKVIARWMALSLLRRVFGGHPDNVLRTLREILASSEGQFPLDTIVAKLKGIQKSLLLDEDAIQALLDLKYGQVYTFPTLALLYPSLDFRNLFHMDHIFPRSFFNKSRLREKGIPEKDWESYRNHSDCLANLQLLEGTPNQEKQDTDFDEWLHRTYQTPDEVRAYMHRHLIPDVDLRFSNFLEFMDSREERLKTAFRAITT
jgi:hypothetical protein